MYEPIIASIKNIDVITRNPILNPLILSHPHALLFSIVNFHSIIFNNGALTYGVIIFKSFTPQFNTTIINGTIPNVKQISKASVRYDTRT